MRNDTKSVHVCVVCKKEFTANHFTARTCSAACRKRLSRMQLYADKAPANIMAELQKIRAVLKQSRDAEQLMRRRNQLICLRDEINDLLLLVNYIDQQSKMAVFEALRRRKF